ncbi:MAG TPA: hypothetical protein PLU39_10435 [Armatimonadota bacterium]|jgi:hypothetical protein|nr:hypothetical protein [Armatimonadota bacterium]HPT98276.1 hypothetical protein [Armatimonadota bacterium]
MMCRYGIGNRRAAVNAVMRRGAQAGSRRWALLLAAVAGFLAMASPVRAAVQVVADLGARVDWSKGNVRVTAAVPASKKATAAQLKSSATRVAEGNLKKLLSRLAADGGMYAIPAGGAELAALVKRAQVIAAGPVSGGRYQVVLQLILPRATEAKTGAQAPASGQRFVEPDPAQVRTFPPLPPTPEAGLLTPPDARGPFTGLIVDTRGLHVRTAMSPRLLDAALRDVYNGAHASAEYAEDVGVVGYMGSIQAALKNPRVGARPLVVRAVGVADAHRACPVVSLEDARRFLEDPGAGKVSATCAVCFVIDSLAARDAAPAPP